MEKHNTGKGGKGKVMGKKRIEEKIMKAIELSQMGKGPKIVRIREGGKGRR